MTLQAEQVEVEDSLEAIFDRYESERWSDGLPIIPPTVERVERFIESARRPADELVVVLPPAGGGATIELIAVNAVMAGCRPEYMPVVIAAVEAVGDPAFNLGAVQGTTNPVAPLLIVNGPARDELGFNYEYGCFGPGSRANATVGRALRLILINIGGGVAGERDMASQGEPAKYTFCVAENEALNPWEPLHVERGFDANDSVVTAVAISSQINSLGGTVEELAEACRYRGNNDYRFGGCPTFALNPAHAERLAGEGLSKLDLKRAIVSQSQKRAGEFSRRLLDPRETDIGAEALDDPETLVPIARDPDDLVVFTAGAPGSGGHSLLLPSFGNSKSVSRRIETGD